MSDKPQPSNNDPTPEERTSDSAFMPVVIGFVVSIVVILIVAIFVIKARQNKIVPGRNDPHPTSQVLYYGSDTLVA
jgi:heme/copper-type cytochrome/quinol oxidase subunit 2